MTDHSPAEITAIKAILQAHQLWLKRRGGRRADLSFRNLSGLPLNRVNLTGAKLAGACLVRTRLGGADLSQTDLFGTDLEAADLSGANLAGADLRGANMHRAVLTDAILRGADFRAGVLESEGQPSLGGQTRLTEARLERSILAGANLEGCDLTGADLNDADLTGADLGSAILLGTDLSGAVFDNARFGQTVLDQQTLKRTYIPFSLPPGAIAEPTYTPLPLAHALAAVAAHEAWVNSQGAEGRRLDLDMVEVVALNLDNRVLSGARLRRCRLPGLTLRMASLEMADLSYSEMDGVDMRGAGVNGANLRRTRLTGAQLNGVTGRPVMLSGGRPWPTNLEGADLSGADLSGAEVGDAIITNARLTGARLDNSGITGPVETPPPPPLTAQERRRHKRYARPALTVESGGVRFATRNWSIGGMCLHTSGHPFVNGQTVQATVILDEAKGITAPAEFVVVHSNRGRAQASVRFDRYSDALKAVLKTAFLEHQRIIG